jgi:hypothetical protein
VPTSPAQNGLDRQARAALAEVRLDSFKAEPSRIEPFGGSKLAWEVTVPEGSDVSIEIDIDGIPIATSGELLVAPASTTSYQLRAQALGISKVLGTVTADVDLSVCIALSAEPVFAITEVIKYQIKASKSGVYFRSASGPIVAIQNDRMIVTLQLAAHVKYFPDPSIDIDASFALDVVPLPRHGPTAGAFPFEYDFHHLVPVDEDISVNISVPWYAWAIPGAIPGLAIALSGYEAKASAQAAEMIGEIVQALDGWFMQSYVQPPKMDKHDAGFYVNPQGDQRFWINFCPAPGLFPVSAP